MDYIDIDTSKIPYQFDIKLDGNTYTFDVKYNNAFDYFTVDLYKQGKLLVYGEKIVIGRPMFDVTSKTTDGITTIIPKTSDYPKMIIMPYDLPHKETRVTFDNLGVTVFLYIITEDDLNA